MVIKLVNRFCGNNLMTTLLSHHNNIIFFPFGMVVFVCRWLSHWKSVFSKSETKRVEMESRWEKKETDVSTKTNLIKIHIWTPFVRHREHECFSIYFLLLLHNCFFLIFFSPITEQYVTDNNGSHSLLHFIIWKQNKTKQ